jgi:hypothetical protein
MYFTGQPAPLPRNPMSLDPDDDPFLEAQIEAEIARTIQPGEDALPPEVHDELRMLLRIGLRHHPDARRLLENLRPAPSVTTSDTIATAAFKNRKNTRTGGAR